MISPIMTAEQAALAQRLSDYRLDAVDAAFPLSKRVARENAWTPDHTGRVIEEYKRFAFLAVVAGHPVSPSKDVDAVWHTHLLYTSEYWMIFCDEVLRTPLHHNPSKGGQDEHDKHDGMYADTLASYERLFGEKPPSDIWPSEASTKEPAPPSATRGIVRKSTMETFGFLAVPVVIALVAISVSKAVDARSIFDQTGPEFLQFFAWLTFAAACLGICVRWIFHIPNDGPDAVLQTLTPFQIAYLSGGPGGALNAAMLRLVNAGRISMNQATKKITRSPLIEPIEDTLEAAIYEHGGQHARISMAMIPPVRTALQEIRIELQQERLYPPRIESAIARMIPFAIMMCVIGLGIVKVAVGVSRDKPVTYLIMMCVFGTVISLLFLQDPGRSRYGKKVTEELGRHYFFLKHASRKGSRISADELVIAYTLFGSGALFGWQGNGQYAPMARSGSSWISRAALGGGVGSSGGGGGGSGGGCGGGGGGGAGCGGCGGG